jgi:hypothetical protein
MPGRPAAAEPVPDAGEAPAAARASTRRAQPRRRRLPRPDRELIILRTCYRTVASTRASTRRSTPGARPPRTRARDGAVPRSAPWSVHDRAVPRWYLRMCCMTAALNGARRALSPRFESGGRGRIAGACEVAGSTTVSDSSRCGGGSWRSGGARSRRIFLWRFPARCSHRPDTIISAYHNPGAVWLEVATEFVTDPAG